MTEQLQQDPPYRKKVFDLLAGNFGDFKTSEQDFYKKLDTDPAYTEKVFDVLSKNFDDFKRPKEEFVSMLVEKKNPVETTTPDYTSKPALYSPRSVAASQSKSPSPSGLTYNDIEAVLVKSNDLRKKVENNDKLALKAQEMGWGESWKNQVKQDKSAYDAAQLEKNSVLQQYGTQVSRPVDILIENGDYKKFFNEDDVFDEGKAVAYFQKVSEKYGGGSYLQNQWVVNLKSKAQLEMDKPRFNALVSEEMKKSGIKPEDVNIEEAGKKLFDKLTQDKRATAESLVKERDAEASRMFITADNKAKEAATAFDQQATALNEQIKAGTITYENAVEQYDQLKKQYDLVVKGLDNGYKEAIRKVNIKFNGKFTRIEDEIRQIGSTIDGDKAFESLPPDVKKKFQQVYINASTRLSDEKNAKAKEKDKNASFLPTGLNIFGKGIVSGLNQGLANIGEYLNMQGYSGGLVNSLRGRATAAESFAPAQYKWNKDEWLKRALASTSTSIGASAPILLPTIGALVATGGGAAGVVGAGLGSFAGESAQLGGEQFKQSLTQTGDVEEASKKSEQMMRGNMITMPLYFIGGMGDAMIATGKGLRKLATGVALEQLEEVPTEYIQSYNQAVANGYKKGIGAFIKENPEIAADTFISTVGQGAAMKGFSKALSPLQKFIPNSTTQMLTDVVTKNGVDFANALIDKWYENGKISKEVVATLKQDVTKISAKIPKLQEAGVEGDKAKLMSSLSAQSQELSAKVNAEQDPALKAVYQNQLNALNQDINDLTKENAPYVVFKVPGSQNDTRVMTVREFNALPAESSSDLVKSSDGITVVGDEALNQKLTEQKKQVGNPEGVAPGIYTIESAVTSSSPELSIIDNKPAGKRLFNDPNPAATEIETSYKQQKGIVAPEPVRIEKLDEAKSKSIADAYDAMQDNPSDPEVKASYEAMAGETMDQFGAIAKSGVVFEVWEGQGEPYKNSEELIKDVRDNKHMYILSTEKEFGGQAITDKQRERNPLLRDSGAKDKNGKPLLINDVFRGVHDFFGHTKLGNSFGAIGEENAWNVHARMYSPLARRAMTTETRGQNSWVNFGPQMRNEDGSIKKKGDPGYLSPRERAFAEQKIGLLPEEFSIIEESYSVTPSIDNSNNISTSEPKKNIATRLKNEIFGDTDTKVQSVQKALKSTGVKVTMVDNAEEFDKRVAEAGGQRGLEGVFLSDTGEILINRSKLDQGIADGKVVWHEASHPVVNIVRNTNPELFNKVVSGLNAAAANNQGVAEALAWAKQQYKEEGQGTIDDEAVVETIAGIAEGTIDISKLSTGLKQSIIDIINRIAKTLGFGQVLDDTDVAAFKKLASQISEALTQGTDISEIVGQENVRDYMNNIESPEVVAGGTLNVQGRAIDKPAINVYESKEVEPLPQKSLEEVYEQFGGKAVVINSDPTRVGELQLPSGKTIFMYGGPAYLAVKDNVEGSVGFATTQQSKVNTWSKYIKGVFDDKPGVTLIGTQAPTSMLSNSYALRYVMDAISMLPKSVLRSAEFKKEFFGKDLVALKDAFGEDGYNAFVKKYKSADLSNSETIDKMISEMAYTVGDNNSPASFKARGAFVSNLLGGLAAKADIKTVEGDKGYVSKKPQKFIAKQLMDRLGINAEKVMYELGEKSLVDMYMNEGKWGFAVAGFETDPNISVQDVQDKGVTHPLFNAKFPGKNAFILDGAYDLNQMFTPVEMTGPSGAPYTKTASQMLAGSMYVKGKPSGEQGSFEYKKASPAGRRIQASKGNRLESSKDFKLAAFVMREKAEGAPLSEIVTGIASVFPTMSPAEIKSLVDDPENWLRGKFSNLSPALQDNLISRAKVQNIYAPTPMSGAGTTNTVPMSAVEEAVKEPTIKEKANKALTNFKNNWIDSAKGLPDWVMSIRDFAAGTKQIEISKAELTIRQLKAVAKNIGFNDWDAFSEAMKSIPGPVQKPVGTGNNMVAFNPAQAAAGAPYTIPNNMLPQTTPPAVQKLPLEIIPFVYKMRGQIDGLTNDLIGSGYVTPEQAAKLEANLGQYVNRAYRLYNEKGWKPSIDQIRETVKFLADQYISDIAAQQAGVMTPEEIQKKAIERAQQDVNEILDKKTNPYFASSNESRNMGILKERKDIPEPIRKLMGEYTDPGTVFIMTVAKQAALKASSEYLTKLRKMGMGSIFFEPNDPNRPASASIQIAGEGSDTKSPLNGLYTTPEVAEALESVGPTYNEVVNLWMKVVGAVRWGKTVGSIKTQILNFESNLGFAVMNGLLMTGDTGKAFNEGRKYVGGQYSQKEISAITEKAIKLGLVNQSVSGMELQKMLGSGDIHDIALDLAVNPDSKYRMAKKAPGKVLGVFNKLYRMGDDFWKVYAYISERELVSNALFNKKYDELTDTEQADVDIEASERVKNTWPTYDRVFPAVKAISEKTPIFGNFISFRAESLRVLANSISMAMKDLKSDNPGFQGLGARRMAGILSYIAIRSGMTYAFAQAAGMAASGLTGLLFGGDDEEDRKKRAIKQAAPAFMHTQDLAVIPTKEPHKFIVYSLSGIDPYNTTFNTLNALTDGTATMNPGASAAFTEFFGGFLSPEMTFNTAWSVLTNTNPKNGDRIVGATDDGSEAYAKVGAYLFDELKPSTIGMIQRLAGDNPKAELSSLLGAKPYEVDLHKSFSFAMSDMGKQIEEINRQYNRVKYDTKSSAEDKKLAQAEAEQKKSLLIQRMNQRMNDYILVGADPKELKSIILQRSTIKTTGFDKPTKFGIITGKVNEQILYK
jgi:hypothetical protein